MKKAMATQRTKMTVSNYINKNISRILSDRRTLNQHNDKMDYTKALENDAENENAFYLLWGDSRGHNSYNLDFRMLSAERNSATINKKIPENILDYLIEEYKKTKKTLHILDDGAGQGYFLKELKEALTKNKVPVNTTAVCLSDKIPELNNRFINEIIIRDAKDLELNQKYDLITSYYGSIHYSIPKIRDEIMKKYIFSLNKNGVAVFRFTENREEPGAKSITWIKLLEKVGFSVTTKIENSSKKWTVWLVLIQRLR
ncbi:MAG: hypothetical protein WCX73_00810 [Candidatus Pacearchaeota archaeon]|jgi:hypothetical protein